MKAIPSISFFSIITAILLSSMSSLLAQEKDDRHRVITYNCWYVFNHKKEIDAGTKWLKEQDPDVVALQELTSIKPEYLADLAKRWDHTHSALLKTGGFSVGITAKGPITIVEKRLKGMHHGYMHVTIADIHYFIVHLSPFKHEVRTREAKILTEKIKPLIDAKKKVIVLGDFNAVSKSDSDLLPLQKDLIQKKSETDKKHGHVQNLKNGKLDFGTMDIFFHAGLIDSAKGHLPKKADIRFSIPTGVWTDKKTPPSAGERIDYILTGPILHQSISRVEIPKEGVLNKVSDHYPVVVDFSKAAKK